MYRYAKYLDVPIDMKIEALMYDLARDILVAPWLQKSPKTKIIHGISGIPTQYLVPKEKLHY